MQVWEIYLVFNVEMTFYGFCLLFVMVSNEIIECIHKKSKSYICVYYLVT